MPTAETMTNMLAVNDETPVKLNEISEVVLLRRKRINRKKKKRERENKQAILNNYRGGGHQKSLAVGESFM